MRLSTRLLSFCLFTRLALSDISCGISSGYDRGVHAYFYSGDGTLANFDACSAKCQADPKCQSLAFGNAQCLLYSEPLVKNFREQPGSPFLFYDRNCVEVKSTSVFTTILPPTVASSVASVTAVPETTSPAPASATSEAGGSAGSNESGGISSIKPAGPGPKVTSTDPVGGQPGASQTEAPTTLPTAAAGDPTSPAAGITSPGPNAIPSASDALSPSSGVVSSAPGITPSSGAAGTAVASISSASTLVTSTHRTGSSTSTPSSGASPLPTGSISVNSASTLPHGKWMMVLLGLSQLLAIFM